MSTPRLARTHTLHDPARWKVQHIGRYVLSGTGPHPTAGSERHPRRPVHGRHLVGGGHGTPATESGRDRRAGDAWCRDRPPTVAYLSQITRAAEDLGFDGELTRLPAPSAGPAAPPALVPFAS